MANQVITCKNCEWKYITEHTASNCPKCNTVNVRNVDTTGAILVMVGIAAVIAFFLFLYLGSMVLTYFVNKKQWNRNFYWASVGISVVLIYLYAGKYMDTSDNVVVGLNALAIGYALVMFFRSGKAQAA